MFELNENQIVYNIAGIKIGGNLGENPTVMIGSIFYKGDKIVSNEKKGEFDRQKAQKQILKIEDLSDRTGISSMIDIVCSYPKATEKYLEFMADSTHMPLLIDAVSEEAAVKGLEYSKEIGILDRIIFNSITPKTKDMVYTKIKEIKLHSAIILTYSMKAIISSQERLKQLEILLPKVKLAGITNILVDTVVLDISTLGLACKAIYEVKDKYGFPSGCGAHNAVSSWKSLKRRKNNLLISVCSSIANGLPIAIGADFVLYGPISNAEYMFPAISLIDAAYGQVFMEKGKRLNSNHPRFKIARF